MPEQGSLGDRPTLSVERRNAEADGVLVVLVTQLLELEDARFPEAGKLDLDSFAGDYSISFGVSALGNVKPLRGAPSCD